MSVTVENGTQEPVRPVRHHPLLAAAEALSRMQASENGAKLSQVEIDDLVDRLARQMMIIRQLDRGM